MRLGKLVCVLGWEMNDRSAALSRLGVRAVLIIACLGFVHTANATEPLAVDGNRIWLIGTWRISFERLEDEFTLVVRTVPGERRIQIIDDEGMEPETIFENDPSGWFIDVISSLGLDEDDCLDPAIPCVPAEVQSVQVDFNTYRVGIEKAGALDPGEIANDVVLRFELLANPPSGDHDEAVRQEVWLALALAEAQSPGSFSDLVDIAYQRILERRKLDSTECRPP